MRRTLLTILILVLLFAPTIAGAADFFPLVPCGGTGAGQIACTPCDIFKTFKNVIDLVLLGVTGPLAAFMIVLAGGMMLLGGGKPALYSQGTTMLKNTLIGVAIILLAWVVTNTLIKTLIPGKQGDRWFEFSCPAFLDQPPEAQPAAPVPAKGSPEKPAPELAQANAAYCKEENLAMINKVPLHHIADYKAPPNTDRSANSPSLNTLTDCLIQDPIVKELYDPNQLFTYDINNPLCNLTHGARTCSDFCSHGLKSCHYGGASGNQGAMAADFNVKRGKRVTYLIEGRSLISGGSKECEKDPTLCRSVSSGDDLWQELYRSAVLNKCAYKLLNFEPSKGAHTHVSTTDCTSDGRSNGQTMQDNVYRKPPPMP